MSKYKRTNRQAPKAPLPITPVLEAPEGDALSLEDIVFHREKAVQPEESIDMSDLFDFPPDTAIFRFQEPTSPEMYNIPKAVERLRAQRSEWPELLCHGLCLMMIAHRSPAPRKQTVLLLYMTMVDRMEADRFQEFVTRFLNKFPQLADLDEAVDQEKKDCADPSEELSSLPV